MLKIIYTVLLLNYFISNATQSWMADSAQFIGNKNIKEIIIPGTHDSATKEISMTSLTAPRQDIPRWIDVVYALPGIGFAVKAIIANWAKAQGKNIKEQLEGGIRYLDLRIVRKEKEKFYTCHGLYGTSLDNVIKDIQEFIRKNPKEILLLDFNHLYNMTSKSTGQDMHSALARKLKEAFGNKIVPKQVGINMSIQQLWDKGYQIIILYDDQATVNANDHLLSQDNIKSPWPNKQNIDDLRRSLINNINSRDMDKLFVLQGILTTDDKMVKSGLNPLSRAPGSLEAVAKKVTPMVTQWIKDFHKEGKKLNIVIVDFFTPEYVKTIVELNRN